MKSQNSCFSEHPSICSHCSDLQNHEHVMLDHRTFCIRWRNKFMKHPGFLQHILKLLSNQIAAGLRLGIHNSDVWVKNLLTCSSEAVTQEGAPGPRGEAFEGQVIRGFRCGRKYFNRPWQKFVLSAPWKPFRASTPRISRLEASPSSREVIIRFRGNHSPAQTFLDCRGN